MKSYRNATHAIRSLVKMKRFACPYPNANIIVVANQDTTESTVSSWSMRVSEIHVEIMLPARSSRRVASAVNARRDTLVLAVSQTSTTVTKTNARTTPRVLTVWRATHVAVLLVSLGNSVRPRSPSVPSLTLAIITPNAWTISHIIAVNVLWVIAGSTAQRISTIARTICVRMVVLAPMVSTITHASARRNMRANSARAPPWLLWCTRRHLHARTTSVNTEFVSNPIRNPRTMYVNAFPVTQASVANT